MLLCSVWVMIFMLVCLVFCGVISLVISLDCDWGEKY